MKKKLLALVLALAMALSAMPAAFAAVETAYASTQKVEVDGKPIQFQMYALRDAGGSPTNYIRVRDLAHVLNGTPAKFSVDYDGAVRLTSGKAYTDTGEEMTTPYSGDRACRSGAWTVWVNGVPVEMEAIILTDEQNRDYTYFKLRDLGAVLGFQVDWTAQRGVFIQTGAAQLPDVNALLDRVQGVWYGADGGGRTQEIKIEGNKWLVTTLDNGVYTNMAATVAAMVEDGGRYCIVLQDGTQTSVEPQLAAVDQTTWATNVFWFDYDPAGRTVGSDTVASLSRASGAQLYPQYQQALEQAKQTNLLLMILLHDRYQGALGDSKRTALTQIQGIWYGKDEKTGFVEETQVKGDQYLNTTFDGNTYRHTSATISEASGSAGQYRLAMKNWSFTVVDVGQKVSATSSQESYLRVFSCDPVNKTAKGELVGHLSQGSTLRLFPQYQTALAETRK